MPRRNLLLLLTAASAASSFPAAAAASFVPLSPRTTRRRFVPRRPVVAAVGSAEHATKFRSPSSPPASSDRSRVDVRRRRSGGAAASAARAAVAMAAVASSSDDPSERLRRDAERLRKEAEALEEEMAERRKEGEGSEAKSAATGPLSATSYKSLPGSAWTVSYRFASDPPPKDEEDSDAPESKPRYYSGKIDVLFRTDGYTSILDDSRVPPGGITFDKFWGWDEELSNLDNERYLLFSADVTLPDDDPYAVRVGTNGQRVYFNARIDKDLSRTTASGGGNKGRGAISLGDGKVTVKRDVKPPGGFWGVFSGQGILAEFKYVGDFVCRPIAAPLSEGG